jgi:hypothetical protein
LARAISFSLSPVCCDVVEKPCYEQWFFTKS